MHKIIFKVNMKSLFRVKSLSTALLTEAEQKNSLSKSLGVSDLITLGVGCIIGTGIFVLTGIAAAKHAGPAISISYLISGIVCMLAALAYAELAAMVPVAGSAYSYSYIALGEFIAWLVACGLVLEYTVAASTVSAGWSGYLVGVLNQGVIFIPEYLTKVPAEGGVINLPAVLIASFCGMILIRGTKESVTLNKILVALKLVVIFAFIMVASPHIKTENYANFFPFGIQGVMSGAAAIFFAFLGFDAVATTAEECKNPSKDLPIGIISSLMICTLIYVVVALILTGIVPFDTLNNPEPMARSLRDIGSNIGAALVATGAIAGMITVIIGMMYGQSRIFFVMSRDGLIPNFFCNLHKKYLTPHLSCAVVTIVVASIAGFTPIKKMGEMSSLGTLFALMISSIGVLVLRVKNPKQERRFRCPAVFLVAPLSIISCGYLIFNLLTENYIPFLMWFAAGIFFYFAYSKKHSALNK